MMCSPLKIVLALALTSTSAAAFPDPPFHVNQASGGGSFSGGLLDEALGLDATNDLCSEELSLYFSDDTNLGLQRGSADLLRVCALAGVIFNGAISAVDADNAAFTHSLINTSTGANASTGLELTSGDITAFFYAVNTNFTGAPYLAGKVALWVDEGAGLLLAHPFEAMLQVCNGLTPPVATCPRAHLDAQSGITADFITGSSGNGQVHIVNEGLPLADAITGTTCASVSVASNSTDFGAEITATCDASETITLNFATSFASQAPKCFLTAYDADALSAGFIISSRSTSQVVITAVTGDADAAILGLLCIETR
jgi:hypothetical protein